MDKTEVYNYLDRMDVAYEVTEHKAVFTMEELSDIELPYPEDDAKNLFVRNSKKTKYYLISVRGDKRVDLKEFARKRGTSPLSFASEADLEEILKLKPGSLTPLGLLNDRERKVEFFLDRSFIGGTERIGCHPNDNTATVWLNSQDLLNILEDHGNKTHIVDI